LIVGVTAGFGTRRSISQPTPRTTVMRV